MIPSLPMTPTVGHDLRGHGVTELLYPIDSVLVVAGIPGAGKTTLLRKVFPHPGGEPAPDVAPDGVLVLDSGQAREWWRCHLGRLPYSWWRPLVHATHYIRVLIALRAPGRPVVVHDCATRPWVRHLIGSTARRSGKRVHLLMLDVSPHLAGAAQVSRGRQVRASSFTSHCRRWGRLVHAVTDGTLAIRPRPASAVLIDRAAAARLETIRFE